MAFLAFSALAAVPTDASAQSDIEVELRGGVASAVESLNHYADPGGALGAGIGTRVHDRVSLWADGDLEIMSEDLAGSVVLPSIYLWHYHAGVEVRLVEPGASPWHVRLKGGAGGTTIDTERFFEGGDDFLHTYPSIGGALSVGYRYSDRISLGVTGQVFVAFTDEEETAELASLSPALNAFDDAVSFPVQVFLRIRPA